MILSRETKWFSIDEACNEGEETYLLDKLVDRFEKYNSCDVAVNDTWHNVIWAFIDDRK